MSSTQHSQWRNAVAIVIAVTMPSSSHPRPRHAGTDRTVLDPLPILTGDSGVGLFTGTITVILSCKIVFSRSFQHCSVTVGQGRQIFVLIPTDASSIGTRFEDAFLVDVTGAPFHTLVVGQFIKTISNNLANPGLSYRCPVPHSSCGTIHQNNLKQSCQSRIVLQVPRSTL
jgi:hypothetical protein